MDFLWEVSAISELAQVAKFILEENLQPVRLKGAGPTRFVKACHPGIDERSRVPVSFKVSPDKPIVVLTGQNGCGKSKFVETVLLNLIYAQSIGFAFCKSGTLGVPRQLFKMIGASDSNSFSCQGGIRGQREMAALASRLAGDKTLDPFVVLDEFLTSTDSAGALAVLLATAEDISRRGGIVFATLHNRYVENIHSASIGNLVQLLRPAPRRPYQWTKGVARADVIQLAH